MEYGNIRRAYFQTISAACKIEERYELYLQISYRHYNGSWFQLWMIYKRMRNSTTVVATTVVAAVEL